MTIHQNAKCDDVEPSRAAGVLLHISSLPGGHLGAPATRFIEFLAEAGQSTWQILPVVPPLDGDCPYYASSSFAGNPKLIDLDDLVARDLISKKELADSNKHDILLNQAADRFFEFSNSESARAFRDFCQRNFYWLEDFCAFQIIKEIYPHSAWRNWPEHLKWHDKTALRALFQQYKQRLNTLKFIQYIFDEQWRQTKVVAAKHGIKIFGDLPLFVAQESADCWAHRTLFKMDDFANLTHVAGVPPDYFSPTGQRWGNPVYRWPAHRRENFLWWTKRIQANLKRFDLLRIDHFRGLAACWEIPADAEDATPGKWVSAPGKELLAQALDIEQRQALVAEDLGLITSDVIALKESFQLAGMKVLQFGFEGGNDNVNRAANIASQDFVYSGTHDNDTSRGWFSSLPELTRSTVKKQIVANTETIANKLIEMAMYSPAKQAIIPLQDWLNLGSAARMNTPGTVQGNWRWQFDWAHLTPQLVYSMRQHAEHSGRI
ncbi:MAG: 4-alpha-glucanotransferase [Pseudomonadota bacterium]